MDFSTADLVDQYGEELVSCDTQFRQFGGVRAFSGLIRTMACQRDNALLKAVLATPGNRCVLVVNGGGNLHSALLGDHIAQLAIDNNWSGVIIHGAVRDSRVLAQMPLGIKALGTNPRRSRETGAGEQDLKVDIGGVTFTPGDQLWSDDDGIVVMQQRVF